MDPFIGQIMIFAGNFEPRGWAFCDGQLLAISSNQALFSILGTTYGGDGKTTFALPDLRGRAPIHRGQGPGLSNYQLGQKGGVENVILTEAQIPAHNHGAQCKNSQGSSNDPTGRIPAESRDTTSDDYDTGPTGVMNRDFITNTGGGQAHTNVQPYLALNYVIALIGIYPSRN